ncbi:MAG TPA: EamA family transporter [Bryobacteraceae bacterium]|nr:EamA family transporter [Bryobacteraceae bacterium]
MNTPISSIAWVSFGSVIGSLGAVGLKAGAKHVALNLRALLTNWKLALGLSLYLLSTVFFIKGISRGEISVLFPLVSTGYIWTAIWSKLFFGESFTKPKFIGLGLILIGCVLLGLGKR